MPESRWVPYIAGVIDEAGAILQERGGAEGLTPTHLRAKLAVRVFRELRQEGRLPVSGQ